MEILELKNIVSNQKNSPHGLKCRMKMRENKKQNDRPKSNHQYLMN
jgi:hypothetical protein